MFSKNAICFLGSFFVSLMGFFRVVKKSEINAFSPNRKMGLPLLSPFVPRYANITRLVIGGSRPIHTILLVRHFAQIAQSIVRSVSVYMVNFPEGPRLIGHSYGDPVRWNYDSINANFNITVAKSAGAMPSFCPSRCVFPYEVPCIGIIGKFFVQCWYKNFSHSYGISHLLDGGKYARIVG